MPRPAAPLAHDTWVLRRLLRLTLGTSDLLPLSDTTQFRFTTSSNIPLQLHPHNTDTLSSYHHPEAHYIDNTIVYKYRSRRPANSNREYQRPPTLSRTLSSTQSTTPARRVPFVTQVVQPSPPTPRTLRPHTFTQDTMCTTDVYTYVYPDGRRAEEQQPTFCSASRNGRLCANPVIYNHPPRPVGYPSPVPMYAPVGPAYPFPQQMPPSPPMSSPRGTSSGNEGGRARRESSSSERKHRQSGVYVNGQRVLDLNRKHRSRNERIVIVDSPPTPRTPPKQFASPYTAPPSPIAGGENPQFRYSHVRRDSLRPVIVDERPRSKVEIEVIDNKHRRHHSSESRHSYHSADEEERRRRHRDHKEREERKRQEEDRQVKKQLRIAEQNAKIASRTAVPVPPAPLNRTSTGYGSRYQEDLLADALRRMEVVDHLTARAEDEEEAQRRRLKERMTPHRRATVGPGTRRHRVLYDDGLWRWE
ncbi:hypothetical protein CMEL01_14777 [Colletotrichum melonis]|uniref:Uncharacterized protein n=2 Tax=Colletotrichum acutatum species complex TaxID=2707335 RepID=A0AAI9UMM8_9PEZI|nr:hypothetical protein CMEL01_14777 [Colletotrichum melonis]